MAKLSILQKSSLLSAFTSIVQVQPSYKQIILQFKVMFQKQLKEILIKITQIQYKLENYRQLLNEEIEFNLKDLYLAISTETTTVTAYHLFKFIKSFPKQMNSEQSISDESLDSIDDQQARIQQLESMIKSYNDCNSMNLTFIEFSFIFLTKQNHLLAKLTLERQSINNVPFYLKNYARKILLLECQLHQYLLQFKKKYPAQAELWIKEHTILSESNEKEFNDEVLKQYCKELRIDVELLRQNFKLLPKENIKYERLMALFTLKNCENVAKLLQKQSAKYFGKIHRNTYIRPEFNDCLQRNIPTVDQTSNFSHRQLKSIEKHLQRIQVKSPQRIQLTQKITSYRKKIEKSLGIFCRFFREIIEKQKQLEFHRIELALCTDFYPVLFFSSFQKDYQKSQKQLLLPSTIQQYLMNFGIDLNLNDIFLLFKRYTNRNDGKLTFNEFCQIFDLSETNRKFYANIEKNREISQLQDIDIETKKLYLAVIRESIKTQKKIEKIKQRLWSELGEKYKTDFREIFSCIDGDDDGYVSQTDVRILFKKFMQIEISNEDIGYFWHRMRLNGKQQTSRETTDRMIPYEKFIVQLIVKTKQINRKPTTKKTTVTKPTKQASLSSSVTVLHKNAQR